MTADSKLIAQVEKIKRRSDMFCTAHSALGSRYSRLSLILDLSILGLACWLVAVAFVEPRIAIILTPPGLDAQIWMGLLSVVALFLSILQLRIDWKARSDAHKRSLDLFAEVKRQAVYALIDAATDDATIRRVFASYDLACAISIQIPESDFLPQKRGHAAKVALSSYIETHPSASLTWTRLRFWFRDTFPRTGPPAPGPP
jgi:hypothetical protein